VYEGLPPHTNDYERPVAELMNRFPRRAAPCAIVGKKTIAAKAVIKRPMSVPIAGRSTVARVLSILCSFVDSGHPETYLPIMAINSFTHPNTQPVRADEKTKANPIPKAISSKGTPLTVPIELEDEEIEEDEDASTDVATFI